MCGITGFLRVQKSRSDGKMEHSVRSMTHALVHRGPDDTGIWVDQENGLALGHRRLSVLDVSAAGHQPMHSASGRYVIVFNGEIYNHKDLKKQLTDSILHSISWRGHSDTEILLACIEAWGVEKTVKRLVGMFALALWDRQHKLLFLARDRMGEKPLYYGWCSGGFVFGSELKALRQYPSFTAKLSRTALTLYFRYCYIPAPYSIFEKIFKLEAGCLAVISLSALEQVPDVPPQVPCKNNGWEISRYWSLHEQMMAGKSALIQNEQSALTVLESALKESILLQSAADVPLGTFLSGGVDSSLIAALMQSQSSGNAVKTFTIGFDRPGYNEAEYAKRVAVHLGTDHTELYLSSQQTRDVISLLPELYDEPFADSSQIPTFLISRLAREQVTVALSGDGGDELFGGYNRYTWGMGIWNRFSKLPGPARQNLVKGLLSLSGIIGENRGGVGRLLQLTNKTALFGEKLQKLGVKLDSVLNIDDFYLSLVSEWRNPEDLVVAGSEPEPFLIRENGKTGIHDPVQRMMYLDAMTYLPDDILCKVDRASMGVSLETRVPMLDHRVVELSCRLPLRMKLRNNCSKWALRQILYKYVPEELIERPKQGFAVPLASWLRGPLKGWVEEMLEPGKINQQGYLNPEPIRQKWAEHLSGKMNWEHSLWSVLMFQSWLEYQERN